MGWEHFDRFYCISVKERADRRAQVRAQFASVGIADRVEFVLVDKHPRDSEQGIYESHIDCMRKGIQADAKSFMIFEDDVVFERFSLNRLRSCIQFLSANPEWKLLFLGCMVKRSRRTENRAVLKVKYRSLTHAYAVNRGFAEAIAQRPWEGVPIDDFFCLVRGDVYALYPSFAFQSNSPSDNYNTKWLDRFRRLWGGLLRIQKMNELYQRNRLLVIAIHVIVILTIMVSLLL